MKRRRHHNQGVPIDGLSDHKEFGRDQYHFDQQICDSRKLMTKPPAPQGKSKGPAI
jgi:hypothetical protein